MEQLIKGIPMEDMLVISDNTPGILSLVIIIFIILAAFVLYLFFSQLTKNKVKTDNAEKAENKVEMQNIGDSGYYSKEEIEDARLMGMAIKK